MELRKFLSVFTNQKILFVALLTLPVLSVLTYILNKPAEYESTLTITIVRVESTTNAPIELDKDQYDSFYQLSADEKFSLTLKQWLTSPRIVNDILRASDIDTDSFSTNDLEKTFQVTQASPQVINIQYRSRNPKVALKKGQSITGKLNELTKEVNGSQKSKTGFSLQSQEPLTRPVEKNLILFSATSTIIGLCLAVIGTLLRHYYNKQD